MNPDIHDAPCEVATDEIEIPVQGVSLGAMLAVPAKARGVVIFAHGSGSGRRSPRNRYVADVLNEHHLGTVLADLLTAEEAEIDHVTRELRFDIALLARRLEGIAMWVWQQPGLGNLDCGYFGASTGAAAALIAAANQPRIRAVVSRGGRPDLARDYLPRVAPPVLLVVGGCDYDVLKLNELALKQLNADSCLVVVPRATHLFEEPGTLEDVAQLAADWFSRHLG